VCVLMNVCECGGHAYVCERLCVGVYFCMYVLRAYVCVCLCVCVKRDR
jgi:hypothetical protein